MVYPVKFETQSDLSRALGDSLIDEGKDVYLYIPHALVSSISVEMFRHLGLLYIVYYLVKVPLKLCLADVLFPTSCAGYTVHQAVAITADVVSFSVFTACE